MMFLKIGERLVPNERCSSNNNNNNNSKILLMMMLRTMLMIFYKNNCNLKNAIILIFIIHSNRINYS